MIETERLVIRPPVESDRSRLVEMFTNADFTVFSDGVHNLESANQRFDRMLALAASVPYAKQPVVERESGTIVGYTGVGTVVLDGLDELSRLEWGWRFMPEAQGQGYATEATAALLAVADRHHNGEMLCVIDIKNHPSRRVADKVGFRQWRRFSWPGDPVTSIYQLALHLCSIRPAISGRGIRRRWSATDDLRGVTWPRSERITSVRPCRTSHYAPHPSPTLT